jgi:hypothetical protein
VVFELSRKIIFNNKYPNYVIFPYKWYNKFTIHVPNLIIVTSLLFIKSQFTTMLQMSFTWINASMNMYDQEMSHHFKGPRAVTNGFIGLKNAMIKSLFHFQLQLGFLSDPTDKKKTKGLRSTCCWGACSRVADIYWYTIFPCFGVGNSILKSVHPFQIHSVSRLSYK